MGLGLVLSSSSGHDPSVHRCWPREVLQQMKALRYRDIGYLDSDPKFLGRYDRPGYMEYITAGCHADKKKRTSESLAPLCVSLIYVDGFGSYNHRVLAEYSSLSQVCALGRKPQWARMK